MGNLSSNMTCEEADTTFKLDASLQKRIEARTEERNKKRAEQDELKDPTENQFEFNAKFRQAVSALEAQIAAAQQAKKDGEEDASLETRFTNMTAEHASISALAVEGSQHLPAWDQRQMQISVKELEQAIIDARTVCLPPKKFSFKSKRKAKASAKSKPQPESSEPAAQSEANASTAAVAEDTERQASIFDRNGERIVIQNEKGKDFNIKSCKDSTIIIQGKIGALYVSNCTGCTIVTGPVGAGCHVEVADKCRFYVAAHQLRIHTATNTDFYCQTRSPPIIEHSTTLRFAPYAIEYPNLQQELQESDLALVDCEGNWNDVKDFDWLRQQHSPNWCAIPEEERKNEFAC